MLQLPSIRAPMFDDTLLRSIDWLESFPWRQENSIRTEQDRYEICLQVKDYSPDEVSVKIAEGFIVVEAKHEEKKDDYGYISRQFMRRYQVPEGCKVEGVESKMTPEGLLIVTVPRHPVVKQDTVIPVKHDKQKSKSKL